MIKLKTILESIRNRDMDTSKIYWDVKNDIENSRITIKMYIRGHIPSSSEFKSWDNLKNGELFGGLALQTGNYGQRNGYIVVANVKVEQTQKGFGSLLFKKALEELKKLGYTGIASQKMFRSKLANNLWDRIKDFSDERFDYLNV